MKVYYREVTSRESINSYGKLGFALYLEVVITDDVKPYNYRKHIKFEETTIEEIKEIYNITVDNVENKIQYFKLKEGNKK